MPFDPSLPKLLLDWAIRALSLFNTVALLWLGFTILLTAERRTWGAWAAGSGLVVGGLFFAAHSTLLGRDLVASGGEAATWWRLGWVAFFGAPYLWYAVIAWYSRVLGRRRHRVGLALAAAIGLVALLLLLLVDPTAAAEYAGPPLPYDQRALGVSLFGLYGLLSIGLSLDAIRHPSAPQRFMGDLAQRRARPWLVAAALTLLAVCLAVVLAAAWLAWQMQSRVVSASTPSTLLILELSDLIVSGLIALATIFAGRAIVSYEIFTGKTLPRGGLLRHWRTSLALAGGYAALLGGSLALPVEPIERLLLATILMTAFWALASWRAYVERERSMERLRPFVASQRLYDELLHPALPASGDAPAAFRALCDDVLGARVAYLVALGPLAPLAGPPLAHPSANPPSLADVAAHLTDPLALCVPLDPRRFAGAAWLVPLWSERGLIGALLLGDKRDGNVYTQEEIEIARSTGERLIDTRASAEMARRLMALQRQRLAESQVLDRRARRVLHDDVLPRLHAAVLGLSAARNGIAAPATAEAMDLLTEVHRGIAALLHEMPATASADVTRLGLTGALRLVAERDLAADFDQVTWRIDPAADSVLRALPALSAEVIFGAAREAMRNAARHGRAGDPDRPLHLTVLVDGADGLRITVEDDGVGLGVASATERGGQGLALHGTTLAVIGGTLSATSLPAGTTRVVLHLPAEATWPAESPAPGNGSAS